jgi:hypothetical protein
MKKNLIGSFASSIVLLILLVMTFSGCASSKSAAAALEGHYDSKAEIAVKTPSEESAPDNAREAGAVEEAAGVSGTPSVSLKIIKSAVISIEVKKDTFQDKMLEITQIAEENNGYISNTDSYSNAEGKIASGRIVVRIPSGRFNSVIEKIKKIGEVKSISISGEDVTQEYVDLESRLKNYKAQEEVLLDLMSRATSVADSIEVQRELSYVQEEIEVIKGRIYYLDNLISLSTIDISLYEPQIVAPIEGGGFINAVKRGAEGAVRVANGIAFFFIAISPLLVLAGIIVLIIWGSIRGRNKRRAKKNAQQAAKNNLNRTDN